MTVVGGGGAAPEPYGGGRQSANLADILERVLDKGIVIAGDIQVNLLDIELLTIKLRLVIASLETAKAVGIDWWEHDPWLSGKAGGLELENRRLRERVAELEADHSVPGIEAADAEVGDAMTRPRDAQVVEDGDDDGR
ncbi:gas vesicle protein [Rhodococcus triatomae]|nr:gas vesicle synthesis protein [Rhodococcus triatomae BKS 15-14]